MYNTLEISGALLVPGFSIYLLEIRKDNQKWFYIGMTGDPHYPSARAAFHRISGHLELSRRSTQNQLMLALKKKGIEEPDDLKSISIKMYHFPIPGFERITNDILSDAKVLELKNTPAYEKYKAIQRQVLALENALIFELKNKLLNKTVGKKPVNEIPFPHIYEGIKYLVNSI